MGREDTPELLDMMGHAGADRSWPADENSVLFTVLACPKRGHHGCHVLWSFPQCHIMSTGCLTAHMDEISNWRQLDGSGMRDTSKKGS